MYLTSTQLGCLGLIILPGQTQITSDTIINISMGEREIDSILGDFGNNRAFIHGAINDHRTLFKSLDKYWD